MTRIAGITAACDLKQWGLSTIVLKARDGLGGRIYTIENEGCTVALD